MRLAADSFRKFHTALLDAFPTYGDLSLLVRTGLGENLAEIVSRDGGLRRQVAELITWADSHDLTDKLLEQARNDRPTNRTLADVTLVYEPGRPDDADRSHLDAPDLFIGVPDFPRYGLLGRDDLLNDLVARLTADPTGPEPIRVAISGAGGVGKTALAVALAYHKDLHATFTGGILWASVGPGCDPLLNLNRWAQALGLDPTQYPDPADLKRAVKNRIGTKKLLLVLDNIWDDAHAELLRCGGPNCAQLLTARSNRIARTFAGRDNALPVPYLPEDPAFDLLHSIAPGPVTTDETLARDLLGQVGGLPLAVELLGGYLTQESDDDYDIFADLGREDLSALTDPALRLAQAKAKLEDASGQEITLADLLSLSLEGFSDAETAAFDALGAFAPKPAAFSREAAEAVCITKGRFLRHLVNRNLLEVAGDRLAIHQVTANLARKRLEETKQLDVAQSRHATFYFSLVNEDQGDWRRIDGAYDQIHWAWKHVEDDECLKWIWALHEYQMRRGPLTDYIAWHQRGLTWARVSRRRMEVARLLSNLGRASLEERHPEEAMSLLVESLPISHEQGDRRWEAKTLNSIGDVYRKTGHPDEALAKYEEALPIRRDVGDRAGEAATLNNMGLVYLNKEQPKDAIEYLHNALQIRREMPKHDPAGEARTLSDLGKAYYDDGRLSDALPLFEEAFSKMQDAGHRYGQAMTLNHMGEVYRSEGQPSEAQQCYEQALSIYRVFGHRSGEALTLWYIAFLLHVLDHTPEAITRLREAITLFHDGLTRDVDGNTIDRYEQFLQQLQSQTNP